MALAALAALTLAPAASAWTPISTTPLQNIDHAAVLRTSAGTELVTWDDDNSGLWLWSSKSSTRPIATGAFATNNYAQVASWTNANAVPSLFVYEGLDAGGGQAGPGRAFGQPQTAPRDDSVLLVADSAGHTFMGWAGGYPTAPSFAVNAFQ